MVIHSKVAVAIGVKVCSFPLECNGQKLAFVLLLLVTARVPRRQQYAPASPPTRPRVSAALRSRDAGEARASLGDPGLMKSTTGVYHTGLVSIYARPFLSKYPNDRHVA